MVHVTSLSEAVTYIDRSKWDEICAKWLSEHDESENTVYISGSFTQESYLRKFGHVSRYLTDIEIPWLPDMFCMFSDEHPELYKTENGITIVIPLLPSAYWPKFPDSIHLSTCLRYIEGVIWLNTVPVPVILEIEKRFG